MNWYDLTGKYHQRTFPYDGSLTALPLDWQRELAALWRLEADVNNGGYLQFLENWGRESYVYASVALRKIGASAMADLIDACQALVDQSGAREGKSELLPNAIINYDGTRIKEAGSVLPEPVLTQIYDLSYQFMGYPDDVAALGMQYYRSCIAGGDYPDPAAPPTD